MLFSSKARTYIFDREDVDQTKEKPLLELEYSVLIDSSVYSYMFISFFEDVTNSMNRHLAELFLSLTVFSAFERNM